MRRDRMDKEIWVINVFGTICLVAMIVLFPKAEVSEASKLQASYREVEHYEYNPYFHSVSDDCDLKTTELQQVTSKLPSYRVAATDEDKALMARVVMSEASLLNFDGKCAVANTIINRVLSDKFPDTIEEVIYQRYQFSLADNGEPDAACYDAVEAALTYEQFPTDMFYFRTGHYHTFAEDYCQIGNTYFSRERK